MRISARAADPEWQATLIGKWNKHVPAKGLAAPVDLDWKFHTSSATGDPNAISVLVEYSRLARTDNLLIAGRISANWLEPVFTAKAISIQA